MEQKRRVHPDETPGRPLAAEGPAGDGAGAGDGADVVLREHCANRSEASVFGGTITV